MKILIEQILANERIIFSSKFGKGIATWRGDERKYKEYEVEIDIEDDLIWGKSIKQSSQKVPLISTDGEMSNFIGIFESIDTDGYSVLRIGNSIISFFANGHAFEIGSMIEISANNVIMTPYD